MRKVVAAALGTVGALVLPVAAFAVPPEMDAGVATAAGDLTQGMVNTIISSITDNLPTIGVGMVTLFGLSLIVGLAYRFLFHRK